MENDILEKRIKRGILVVEDNELNREMLKEILDEQYVVLEAENGKEGLAALRKNFRSLSLILLDVQMPEMDGFGFLEEYRKDPMLASVPVIVTTGSNQTEDEERCLSLGASDFVSKPYNPRIILRRIEAIIRLRESIATLQEVEYDSLTGLYTRSAFFHHVQNVIDRAGDKGFDFLMVNVANFPYFNERFGTVEGDRLLRFLGDGIRRYANDALLSCHYQDDRFILMRIHKDGEAYEPGIAAFDRKMHKEAPIGDFTLKYALYENAKAPFTLSVLCDRLTLTSQSIQDQYQTRLVRYDAALSDKIDRMHRIENCMEEALREGQFKVYYQPKHDAKSGKLAGAEALVRWIHPVYGFMSPGDFIPLFEQNGFITDLDLYVWNAVCRDLKEWKEQGITPIPISVNASRRDFVALDTVEPLMKPIRENGIDVRYLHIEVTESLGIGDEIVMKKVRAVRDLGIGIELDDFGSGHSSLGTIRDLPLDVIKLDISFTRQIEKQKEIVQTVISLAHALGHRAVAEGVETEDQLSLLKEFGCDLIQGYYYSKPLPVNDFRTYLTANELLSEV